jgi:hypothetical protein
MTKSAELGGNPTSANQSPVPHRLAPRPAELRQSSDPQPRRLHHLGRYPRRRGDCGSGDRSAFVNPDARESFRWRSLIAAVARVRSRLARKDMLVPARRAALTNCRRPFEIKMADKTGSDPKISTERKAMRIDTAMVSKLAEFCPRIS